MGHDRRPCELGPWEETDPDQMPPDRATTSRQLTPELAKSAQRDAKVTRVLTSQTPRRQEGKPSISAFVGLSFVGSSPQPV